MPLTWLDHLEIETARLTAANWRPALADASAKADLRAALATVLTPEVLDPLPPMLALDTSETALDDWIAARDAECTVLTVRSRTGNELIGLLLLVGVDAPAHPHPTHRYPAIHIGYMMARHSWGQGFASELVAGLLQALHSHAPLHVKGGVARNNPASARVLTKHGFRPNPESASDDTQLFCMTLPRSELRPGLPTGPGGPGASNDT